MRLSSPTGISWDHCACSQITRDTTLDRIVPILARLVACQDVPPLAPSDCGPLDRATAMKRLGDLASGNRFLPVTSEEMRHVEAVFALLGTSIAGRELNGIADVALSHAIVLLDGHARFSLVIAYLQ
jgi:hypothetical protein